MCRAAALKSGPSEWRGYGGKGPQSQLVGACDFACAEPATRAGPLASGGIQALEPVAVADADAVHAFVVLLGIGVGHVLEVNRDVVVLVQVVADFHGDVEQHP